MAQALSQKERAQHVDAVIAAGADRAFALLERLVAQRSVLGHEAGAQQVLADALAALGFCVDWLEIPAAIADDTLAAVPPLPYDGSRRVLTARLAGRDPSRGRSLLINGHLDVVPSGEPGRWTSDPFVARTADGWMHGRGAGDMKGGWAMVVLALEAVLSGSAPAGDLIVTGVIEEECGGNGTLAAVRAGVLADAVLLPEPTDLEILVRGIGILWVDVEISGLSGHAGEIEARGSAIDAIWPVIEALRELGARLERDAPDGERYHVNVGVLEAGDWPSSLPGDARLRARLGFPRTTAPDTMLELVRAAMAAVARTASLATVPSVRPSGFRAEGYGLAEDHALVTAVAEAHVDAHGAVPGVVATNATTDARYYVNQAEVPALCYGPRTRRMHDTDEAVELDSIVSGARTVARFIDGWCGRAS